MHALVESACMSSLGTELTMYSKINDFPYNSTVYIVKVDLQYNNSHCFGIILKEGKPDGNYSQRRDIMSNN